MWTPYTMLRGTSMNGTVTQVAGLAVANLAIVIVSAFFVSHLAASLWRRCSWLIEPYRGTESKRGEKVELPARIKRVEPVHTLKRRWMSARDASYIYRIAIDPRHEFWPSCLASNCIDVQSTYSTWKWPIVFRPYLLSWRNSDDLRLGNSRLEQSLRITTVTSYRYLLMPHWHRVCRSSEDHLS
jgi:hypothetical protein